MSALLGFTQMSTASAGLPDEFEIIKVSDGGLSIFVDAPPGGAWSGPVDAGDCASAAAGASGTSDVVGLAANWKPSLDDFPGAEWISDNPAGNVASASFLIAVPFSVHPDSDSVTLDIDFLSDNTLGDAGNAGLFINCDKAFGGPVVGSTLTGTGLFTADNSLGPFDITPFLNPAGTSNTLFILSINTKWTDGPGGIQYGATFSNVCPPGTVPPDCEAPPVGGELIPLDTTALLIGYSVLNMYWIAPAAIGVGVGIYLVKRRF